MPRSTPTTSTQRDPCRAQVAGTVSVNAYSEGDVTTPFGGYDKSGFGGRDKGLEAPRQLRRRETAGNLGGVREGGSMVDWLITDESGLEELNRSSVVGFEPGAQEQPEESPIPIAVRLHDLVIKDGRWFDFIFGNDVRVDVLAVQGNALENDVRAFYTPMTIHFPGGGAGGSLALDEDGILAYYGWPKHFLDLSIIVSRDHKGSDDLATLLEKEVTGSDFKSAASDLLQLAVAGPVALAVTGAIEAAARLGGLAYRVLEQASGTSIGMYRGNRLSTPPRFGMGRNPASGSYDRGRLSFWFEVLAPVESET